MATWDDVRRLALAMPEAVEVESRGNAQWRVKDKLFVWERSLRRSDREALGDAAPDGPILGARVEHLVAKERGDRRGLARTRAAAAREGVPRGARRRGRVGCR